MTHGVPRDPPGRGFNWVWVGSLPNNGSRDRTHEFSSSRHPSSRGPDPSTDPPSWGPTRDSRLVLVHHPSPTHHPCPVLHPVGITPSFGVQGYCCGEVASLGRDPNRDGGGWKRLSGLPGRSVRGLRDFSPISRRSKKIFFLFIFSQEGLRAVPLRTVETRVATMYPGTGLRCRTRSVSTLVGRDWSLRSRPDSFPNFVQELRGAYPYTTEARTLIHTYTRTCTHVHAPLYREERSESGSRPEFIPKMSRCGRDHGGRFLSSGTGKTGTLVPTRRQDLETFDPATGFPIDALSREGEGPGQTERRLS